MVAREWVFNLVFWERIHLILQWSFISLSLFHLIYTFGWVRIKTSKLLKNPKIHWVRILQQITKWLMIVFSIMVIFTGLTYYDWFDIPVFEGIFPFTKHLKWDLYLSLTIIIHIMTGAKNYFIRIKFRHWISNLLIIFLGGILIAEVIYLEFFAPGI